MTTAEAIAGTFFGLVALFFWGLLIVGIVLAFVVLVGLWRDFGMPHATNCGCEECGYDAELRA